MLYTSAALSWREPGLEDRGSRDRKGAFPKEQLLLVGRKTESSGQHLCTKARSSFVYL